MCRCSLFFAAVRVRGAFGSIDPQEHAMCIRLLHPRPHANIVQLQVVINKQTA
jgi:hypothetical protein